MVEDDHRPCVRRTERWSNSNDSVDRCGCILPENVKLASNKKKWRRLLLQRPTSTRSF